VPYIKATIEAFKEIKHKEDKEFKAMVSSIKDMAMNIIHYHRIFQVKQALPSATLKVHRFDKFISSTWMPICWPSNNCLRSQTAEQGKPCAGTFNPWSANAGTKKPDPEQVRVDLDKQQRDYFLNQQLKTIQEELGGSSPDLEIDSLKLRASKKKWGKEVKDHFNKELEKLVRTNLQLPITQYK